MSNRPRRSFRRRRLTPQERWHADRYKDHRKYTAAEVRDIIIEDGARRRDIPLTWFIQGVTYIAQKTGTTREVVMVELDQACIERCGLPLPSAGVNW